MKSWLMLRPAGGALVLSVLLTLVAAQAKGESIRLRNQTIATTTSRAVSGTNTVPPQIQAAASAPVSGLFLVQFSEPPTPNIRTQLAGAGVDLLHYVPESAFIARFRNVQIQGVQGLPVVQWIGPYQPADKLHRELQKRIHAHPTEPVAASVLLAPRANAVEVKLARRAFTAIKQQAVLRSGVVLRGMLAPARLESLLRSDAVLWVEAAHPLKLFDEVASKIVAGDGGPNFLLSEIYGYDGRDVSVAVADTGLNNGDAETMHPDLLDRTPAFFWYGNLTDAADEHSHGTHVAGIVAGDGATGETDENGALYGLGVAPGASIIAQRIFDGSGMEELPPSFEKLTRDATRAGAVIGSNSWGDDTQGRYDVSAMEFDELVRDADALMLGDQQYILEFSAGNAGPGVQTVGSPAVAKNVIATGASQNDRVDLMIYDQGPDAMADFSSRGPCEDGRIKPDLVCPGTWIASLQSQSATDQYAWAPISPNYQYQGGTSQAGPHASGAAAVFVNYYRDNYQGATPSPALVKAALINATVELLDAGPSPNMDSGWGRLDLTRLIESPLTFDFVDQTVLLTNGQVFEHRILVASPGEPLKVTMAYTDVPGFPGAIPALVNDLDLEVVGPDGSLYRGNQFQNGESIPNAPGADSINNVEGVALSAPQPGEYLVRVRARRIVLDAREETGAIDQDFALAISAVLPVPNVANLTLDRESYTAPSRMKITLVATSLAGQPSTSVLACSGSEPGGERVVLTAAGSSGTYTGAVATATGPATADGRLEVSHNDSIEVVYIEPSGATNASAGARADLVAPQMTNVTLTSSFGQATVAWTTDEPATSVVRYGTNRSSLATVVLDPELTTQHSVTVDGLIANRTYYCSVASADAAGNSATNDNNGALFSFVAAPTATLLLVDEYGSDGFFQPPPLSGYTEPLDQIGIPYEVWDATSGSAPSLSTLKQYRAVIWRVPEISLLGGGVWTAAEMGAISNYLHSGGAMLIASMELLSRLETGGALSFTRDVLQVQSYLTDETGSTLAAEILGSPGETVGNGLDIVMDYSVYENLWGGLVGPDLSDTMTPSTNATPVLRNDAGDIVGLRWPAAGKQASGRLVFLSFALDAAPMNGGDNDRVALLRNVLDFLAPGSAGARSISLDAPAYTLPSVVTVEVGSAELAGQGSMEVTAASKSDSTGISVTLLESQIPGDFLGSFSLVSATNLPASGQLRATNGDIVTVQYSNVVSGEVVSSTALVDTVPPAISNVVSEPDYEQALVSWDTSKPTDALVEFGESPLLHRTAYDSTPGTSHAVVVPGLAPDHTYYYRVVSRDVAGNTTIDDNQGKLYTFHTLLPLMPPWSDDMDTGATEWSVFSGDGSQVEWTLGTPNNGQETSADTPPDAWGSNLNGDAVDYTETFLMSPAIYLSGGNVATLRFAHSYDFTGDSDMDILNYGQLLLVTNNATTAITLGAWSDDVSLGWIEEEIDLTPYVGQMVYLVWDWELFSLETRVRPGWLVDSVSITVSNVAPGTVQITNNLWQATYVLSGPVYRRAKGLGTIITNAPPGQYVLEFADVPYYVTPTSQTNTLAPGATIAFHGNYTFPDVNTNGISDLWEQQFLGSVSSYRTRGTDSDGDGMTDYAEFIAGTDPNQPPPQFRLTARMISGTAWRVEWPAIIGRQYRLDLSTNGVKWAGYGNWLTATSATMQTDVPVSRDSAGHFFRVETAMPAKPSGLPANLRLSAAPQASGGVNLSWPTSSNRGYQVQGSTNGAAWAPVSGWLQANPAPGVMTYSVPAPKPGAPFLFRIEVRP